jgi:hypothetical protein
MWKTTFFKLLFVVFISRSIVSCNPEIPQSPTSPISIHEPKVEPSTFEVKTQEQQRKNNCDGSTPSITYTRSLKTEQTTFFQVNVEGGELVRGTPIPGVLEAELEAKVTAALGNTIVNTGGQDIAIPLQTQKGFIVDHTITWNETRKKGTIQVDYQNGTAEVGFEKVLKIEYYDRTSRLIPCDNSNEQSNAPTPVTQKTSESAVETPTTPVETLVPATASYPGWLICWHGKFNHEFLIAYPEGQVAKGLPLSTLLKKPWDGQKEYLPNDSMKECLYNGEWYGDQNPEWFPLVSYLKLDGDKISLCENGVNVCGGKQWTMDKAVSTPKVIIALLRQPEEGRGIQVLGEINSEVLSSSQ